jgi:hypothetical protein
MQVIDNFFPEEQFKELQKRILSPSMPWYYISNISVPTYLMADDPLAIESPAIQTKLYDREMETETEEYLTLKPYFTYMMHKLGYTNNNLLRIRAVSTWPQKGVTEENYNIPHVDQSGPHQTIVFYLNDADGDTRLFHQKQQVLPSSIKRLDDDATDEEKAHYASFFIRSGFTVEHRVTPKANRLLIFDGLQYHTSGHPLNCERRVVLNLNIGQREKVYT